MPEQPRFPRKAFPKKKLPIGRFAAHAIALRQKAKAGSLAPKKTVVAEQGPDIPEGIAVDAARYLLKRGDVPAFGESEPDAMADWFAGRMVKFNRENRKQHYETIAAAYATYAASRNDPTLQRAVAEAALRQSLVVNYRKSQLRIILELHISYGSGSDAKSVRQAGKAYSRDVAAITNLIKRGVAPSGVIELAEQKGEGLDEWVRWRPEGEHEVAADPANRKANPGGKKARLPRKSPFGQDISLYDYSDRPVEVLVWETRDQSGNVLTQDEVDIDETNVEILNKLFNFY